MAGKRRQEQFIVYGEIKTHTLLPREQGVLSAAYGMCHLGLCSEPVTLRISLNTEKEQLLG